MVASRLLSCLLCAPTVQEKQPQAQCDASAEPKTPPAFAQKEALLALLRQPILALKGGWLERVRKLLDVLSERACLQATLIGIARNDKTSDPAFYVLAGKGFSDISALTDLCQSGPGEAEACALQKACSLLASVAASPDLPAACIPLTHDGIAAGALWLTMSRPDDISRNAAVRDSGPNQQQQQQLHPNHDHRHQQQHQHRTNIAASKGAACNSTGAGTGLSAAAARALLADATSLDTLAFIVSVLLLGADGADQLAWLSNVVHRLCTASTMHTLTAELCDSLAVHVERRFVLEAGVRAALVPGGADTAVGYIFGSVQPPPTPPSGALRRTGSGLMLSAAAAAAAASVVTPAAAAADGASSGNGNAQHGLGGAGAGGGKSWEGTNGVGPEGVALTVGHLLQGGGSSVLRDNRQCRHSLLAVGGGGSACAAIPANSTVLMSGQNSPRAPPADNSLGVNGGAGAANARVFSPRQLAPTAPSHLALPLPPPACMGSPAMLRSRSIRSLLMLDAGAAGGCGLDGARTLSGSMTRSIVVPLHLGVGGAAERTDTGAGGGGGCWPYAATVHTHSFPLHQTLLQSVVSAAGADGFCSSSGAGSGRGRAGPRARGLMMSGSGSALSLAEAAVVEDVCARVQDVHRPCRDVTLLMHLVQQQAQQQHAAGGAGGPLRAAGAGQSRGQSQSQGFGPAPGLLCATSNAAGLSAKIGPGGMSPSPCAYHAALATCGQSRSATGVGMQQGALRSLALVLLNVGAGTAAGTGGELPPYGGGASGGASGGGSGGDGPVRLSGISTTTSARGPAAGSPSTAATYMGLYVCFAARLPRPLLEAVQASCQELVDQLLCGVVASRVLHCQGIAAECEVFKSAVPGSYAVLRGLEVADDATGSAATVAPSPFRLPSGVVQARRAHSFNPCGDRLGSSSAGGPGARLMPLMFTRNSSLMAAGSADPAVAAIRGLGRRPSCMLSGSLCMANDLEVVPSPLTPPAAAPAPLLAPAAVPPPRGSSHSPSLAPHGSLQSRMLSLSPALKGFLSGRAPSSAPPRPFDSPGVSVENSMMPAAGGGGGSPSHTQGQLQLQVTGQSPSPTATIGSGGRGGATAKATALATPSVQQTAAADKAQHNRGTNRPSVTDTVGGGDTAANPSRNSSRAGRNAVAAAATAVPGGHAEIYRELETDSVATATATGGGTNNITIGNNIIETDNNLPSLIATTAADDLSSLLGSLQPGNGDSNQLGPMGGPGDGGGAQPGPMGGPGGGGVNGSSAPQPPQSWLWHCDSIIRVTGLDAGDTARQHMDLLVSSIQATCGDTAALRSRATTFADDLAHLRLCEVLGRGGGGVVLRGKSGTTDVAVKLMEMPITREPDAAIANAAANAAANATPAAPGAATPEDPDPAASSLQRLRARRTMLRNAMELWCSTALSHPNIVQVYNTFNSVVLKYRRGTDGAREFYLLPAPSPDGPAAAAPTAAVPGASQPGYCASVAGAGGARETIEPGDSICTALLVEWCDKGSLAGALISRTFPRTVLRQPDDDVRALAYNMKDVYLTLLDVAMALRHLHALRFVHRDLKTANVLLKSNPRDCRGFTAKLADFGFVLPLSEVDAEGVRYAVVDQPCGTVTHMAPEALSKQGRLGAAADVFAFGIIMWEMLAGGMRPYSQVPLERIPRVVTMGGRPTFADNVPVSYRRLATACWSAIPSKRPHATELVATISTELAALL